MIQMTIDQQPRHFIVVGTGGTGGYLIDLLSRLLHVLPGKYSMTIIDGDIVEENNLQRQNFEVKDIGKYKAETLAAKYNNMYNVPIGFFNKYISNQYPLTKLVKPYTCLIGCVDNVATRKLLHETYINNGRVIQYIDSGNSEWKGQVVNSIYGQMGVRLKSFTEIYGGTAEDHPEELSCAEVTEHSPQNIATNMMAANVVFNVINYTLQNDTTTNLQYVFNAQYNTVIPIPIEMSDILYAGMQMSKYRIEEMKRLHNLKIINLDNLLLA